MAPLYIIRTFRKSWCKQDVKPNFRKWVKLANTPVILSVNIRNKSTNKVSLEKSESCNFITWRDFFRTWSSYAHLSLTLPSMKSNESSSASVTPSVSWSLLNIIPIFFPPYCLGKEKRVLEHLLGAPLYLVHRFCVNSSTWQRYHTLFGQLV